MILDEPFAAVDEHTQHELMQVIKNWHAEGRTVIIVLHDLQMVREHVDQTLLLAHQVVAWGKTEQVLSEENLRQAADLCARGLR